MKTFSPTLLVILCFCFSACNNQPKQQAGNVTTDSTTTLSQSVLSDNDLLRIDSSFVSSTITDTNQAVVVTGASAISIVPSTIYLEKERQTDSDGYDAGADDANYYNGMAIDTLTQFGIPVTAYSHNKRYIVFNGPAGPAYTFDGNKIPDLWGIILFNGKDAPVLWGGTYISGAVKLVYKK